MKVLDLQCANQHVFEGWFASEDDFQQQKLSGFLVCPVCESAQIVKRLSAPRLNLGAVQPTTSTPAPASVATTPQAATAGGAASDETALQAAVLQLVRQVVAKTEDVGTRFAEVARQMHHSETEDRSIRGIATPKEAAELREEGIHVLPLPSLLKEPLQ